MSERLLGLAPGDFLLPPEKFVDRCRDAFNLADDELSSEEIARLADMLRGAHTRIEAARALIARKNPLDRRAGAASMSLPAEFHGLVDVDLLKRVAPQDNSMFVNFLFEHFLPGISAGNDALSLAFALRSGSLDRDAVIGRVVAKARARGANLPHSLSGGEAGNALGLGDGILQSLEGEAAIVLVGYRSGFGWLMAPRIWRQEIDFEREQWNVDEGWVLCSARHHLDTGPWRLDIDLVQPSEGLLLLDVVANAGLDTLARVMFEGPAACAVRFDVLQGHKSIELRMFKPKQNQQLSWFKIFNLSITRRPTAAAEGR